MKNIETVLFTLLVCSLAAGETAEGATPVAETCPPPLFCSPPTSMGECVPDVRALTYEAGPQVCGCYNFYLSADFVYWYASQEGLGFADTYRAPQDATVSVTSLGKTYAPDPSWDPGFKVSLGGSFDNDGWDIEGQYTWYQSLNNKNSVEYDGNPNNLPVGNWNIGTPNVTFPAGAFITINFPVTRASGLWNLQFNTIDLSLGRNYYVGRFLKLHPFIGLKGTWQEQLYKAHIFTSINPVPGFIVQQNGYMRQKLDFWGIGVRGGFHSLWQLRPSISLYGNFAFSGLSSSTEVHRKDRVTASSNFPDPNFNFDLVLFRIRDSYHGVRAVAETAAGVQYDYWSSGKGTHFLFQAGWEGQLWIGNSQFYARLEETAHGDLALQGLTIKARLDF